MLRWTMTMACALVLAGCDGDDGSDGPAGGDTDAADGSDPDDSADEGEGGNEDGGEDGNEGGGEDGNEDGGEDGNEDGGDDADPADEGDDGDDGSEALSFATDIAPILAQRCGCHSGGAPSAGLDLSPEGAYAALVGVMSGAGIPFVAAGDASQSYLVNKLDGSQADVGGSGSRMPVGGELPADEVDTIVEWIDAGAPE